MNNNSSKRSAFTLIELLVVISIILIASSIIFVGGGSGGGVSLSSSRRIVSGIVQGARGQALLKHSTTRVIIHNDPADIDKYRRFFGIVFWELERTGISDDPSTPDDESVKGAWIAGTQGTYLPEGIYFDLDTSDVMSGNHWPLPVDAGAKPPRQALMTLEFPRISRQTGSAAGAKYAYYEFNSNGTSANSNAYLVLRAATMIPGATGVDKLLVDEGDFGLYTGLILRRAGTVTPVLEPDAITPTSTDEIKK